jgi:hypothetical protein
MSHELLRKFCESRHRSLIVIAGTFVAGLLLLLPIVDAYYAGRDEKNGLQAELDAAKRVAADLAKYEQRATEKVAQLAAMEARTVDDDSLPMLRGRLVDLAKETDCIIRRLTPGAASKRPWAAGDDPLAQRAPSQLEQNSTGFVLEWRPVNLSLSGTSDNLRAFLDRLTSMAMFMHTKSLDIYPASPSRQSLTMDLELWYFTLTRKG